MTSIDAYISALKNIRPEDLYNALGETDLTTESKKAVLIRLWDVQRNNTLEERKASDLPFITEEELAAGIWVEYFDVKGQLTDAFKDNVGIVEQQRVMMVVDGKIKQLNPDDVVTIFGFPEQPTD